MAASVSGTGPYQTNTVNGVHTHFPMPTFVFCSPLITTPGTYPGVSGTGVCDFGAQLSQVYISNLGTGDLCFQWKEQFGTQVDGGYVPKGESVRIDRVFKTGLAVRSADSAASTSCIVWGI